MAAVHIDTRASLPVLDQPFTQIIDGIRDGRLLPGTRLPTIRAMAARSNLAA